MWVSLKRVPKRILAPVSNLPLAIGEMFHHCSSHGFGYLHRPRGSPRLLFAEIPRGKSCPGFCYLEMDSLPRLRPYVLISSVSRNVGPSCSITRGLYIHHADISRIQKFCFIIYDINSMCANGLLCTQLSLFANKNSLMHCHGHRFRT